MMPTVSTLNTDARCNLLLEEIRCRYPTLATQTEKTRDEMAELFFDLGERVLAWAAAALGDSWPRILSEGYAYFVTDVNKEQMLYNKNGRYRNTSYDEVYRTVYDNDEYMSKYHWGVFATSFLWAHHLEIYRFFKDRFLPRLEDGPSQHLDLGSGSGLWSCLVASDKVDQEIVAVDISKTSLDICMEHAKAAGVRERVTAQVGDALQFDGAGRFRSGTSCFLLEHLERPGRLIETFKRSLATGAPVFLTAAVTAAEVDHIFEFKTEGEVVTLLEDGGLRVVEMLSAAPPSHKGFRFLPRSVAFIAVNKTTANW